MAQGHVDMPEYLLAVEVGALLHYLPDLYQQTCTDMLWNAGARINEGLALTRADFNMAPPSPYVSLATLKQRQEKAARGPGAPSKKTVPHRLVPLSDSQYLNRLNSMIATLRIPLERKNKRTSRMEPARIWLNDAVARAAGDGVTFSVPVTPHTMRHSYAMHMLYSGVPLEGLMGHKSMKSTEVYTRIFALDVAVRHRVQFSMPGPDAVAMLRQTS